MAIHHFAHLAADHEVDYDRAVTLADALERSLSALSVGRLQAAAAAATHNTSQRNRASVSADFDAAQKGALPQTLLRHCKHIRRSDIALEEKLMIMATIDQDELNLLAAAGLLPAREVILSAAFSGGLEHVQSAWDMLNDHIASDDRQSVLDCALAFCAYEQELEDGNTNHVSADKVTYLIAQGANPNAHDIWQQAIDNSETAIHAAFVKGGADFAPLLDMIDDEEMDYHYKNNLAKGLGGAPVYARVDDNTLLQITFLRPLSFHHRLETLYRFDLGRITETQVDADGKKETSHAARFAEVPVETLAAMHDTLSALGGKPAPLDLALGGSLRASIVKPLIGPKN